MTITSPNNQSEETYQDEAGSSLSPSQSLARLTRRVGFVGLVVLSAGLVVEGLPAQVYLTAWVKSQDPATLASIPLVSLAGPGVLLSGPVAFFVVFKARYWRKHRAAYVYLRLLTMLVAVAACFVAAGLPRFFDRLGQLLGTQDGGSTSQVSSQVQDGSSLVSLTVLLVLLLLLLPGTHKD